MMSRSMATPMAPATRKAMRQGDEQRGVHETGGDGADGLLHDEGRVGADHHHFAVRHVDDAHDAEGDGETDGGEQQDRTERQAVPDVLSRLPDRQSAPDADGGALGCLAHPRGRVGGQRAEHGERVLVAAALDDGDGGDAVRLRCAGIGDEDGGAGLLHQRLDAGIAFLADGGLERRQGRAVARLEDGLRGCCPACRVGVHQGQRAHGRLDGAAHIVVETYRAGGADIGCRLTGRCGQEGTVGAADEDGAVGLPVDEASVAQGLDDSSRPGRAGSGEAVHGPDDVVEGFGGETLGQGGVVLRCHGRDDQQDGGEDHREEREGPVASDGVAQALPSRKHFQGRWGAPVAGAPCPCLVGN